MRQPLLNGKWLIGIDGDHSANTSPINGDKVAVSLMKPVDQDPCFVSFVLF
jgi:hypothetical protein